MYKPVSTSILFALSMMSVQNDARADNFYLPKLKCSLRQDQFYSELFFKKADSHPESKGFEGELKHYVVNGKEKRFISGMAFKSVFYQQAGMISGLIGDEFATTGSFSLSNPTRGKTGTWRFSTTDISGTNNQALFECVYNTRPPGI